MDQLNAQLARLVAKMPEAGGAMVNDFAIKGVMATLRELKTKIEGMNRRRFVIKKVIGVCPFLCCFQNAFLFYSKDGLPANSRSYSKTITD